MNNTPRPLIVGGGWAGLAAGVELTAAGHRPLLLEASPQLGGRARGIKGSGADNGEHLFIGAYAEILRLLKVCGVAHEQIFRRQRFHLRVIGPERAAELRARPLPFPFDLASALLLARGLPRAALWRSARILLSAAAEQGETVEGLFERTAISPPVRRYLWEPLCLAALNTPATHASAQVFLRVLADAFGKPGACDLLFPRDHLSTCFPKPAARFIAAGGGEIRLKTRAVRLVSSGGRMSGAYTANGEFLRADHVVVATAPRAAARLLSDTPLSNLSDWLATLPLEAVTTVYLRYPPHIRQGGEMIGWVGRLGQWSFDHRARGQPGLIGVVIGGNGPHLTLSKDALLGRIEEELAALHPQWPRPLKGWVIRDRQATFRCDPQTAETRPTQKTAIKGCWLAGDYTATGYPATLEGAVRSGVQCARLVAEAIAAGTGESHG